MTVSTEISREEYTGNGVTTDFDYRFRVFYADELVVSVADTTENISLLVLNTDYTVTGAGSRTGGKVKLTNPLANAWRISIERDLPVTQETDVRNQGNFFPEVHEDAWDKLTMLIQQALGSLGLALRKPNWLAKYYDAKGNRISNLADPIADKDAVNRRSMYSYVEKMIAGVVGGYGWFVQFGTGAIFRTFQSKMRESLSVDDFGAVGDAVNGTATTPTTGTDDTAAFKRAFAAAVDRGMNVRGTEGKTYLVTEPINMGGEGYVGSKHVAFIGGNWVNTKIIFKNSNPNLSCFEIIGGSGTHTGGFLDEVQIEVAYENRYKNFGLLLNGSCFVKSGKVLYKDFYAGVHLLNSSPGNFTEYNTFVDSRFHYCRAGILMEVNGGDNSFRTNNLRGCMFQVKTTVDRGDGDTTAGCGIELRGVSAPAYWYASEFDVTMFGGPGAIAIKLTKANTDALVGNITAEGALILQSTDALSSFEVKGGFYSIGSVTFNTVSEPAARASTFIFENRMSNTANFSSPRISSLSPRQLPLYLADRTDNGGYPAIFRATASNLDGLCYAVTGTPGSNHLFGYIPAGGNLHSFVPGYSIGYDGSSLASYSSVFYLSNATVGIQIAPSFFGPRTDNQIDCGAAAYRPKQYWGVNSSISTSDARHKTDPREVSDVEADAFYEIGKLPWVWQWLEKYNSEGEDSRVHAGPTVQAAISVMDKYALDWRNYSAFCYDEWDAVDEFIDTATGNVIPAVEAGDRYSFRKEELLMWIARSVIIKQNEIEGRLLKLENLDKQ